MADAKKCDRCGEVYTDITIGLSKCCNDEFTFTYIKLIYSTTSRGKPIDLCQRCIDELCKWLNNDEEKRLTCREILAKEFPEFIDPSHKGGCVGCPASYKYVYNRDGFCKSVFGNYIGAQNELCTKCWNQVATRYYDDKKENTDVNN